MREFIKRLYHSQVIRYLFFGGCTTLVNLVVYYGLRFALPALNYNIANTVAVAAAILFAYVVNARFVFASRAHGFVPVLAEAAKFIGARLSTMVIEVGGVWLFVEVLHIHDMIAKIIIQFVVIVLNYIFSKFLVFTKKGRE